MPETHRISRWMTVEEGLWLTFHAKILGHHLAYKVQFGDDKDRALVVGSGNRSHYWADAFTSFKKELDRLEPGRVRKLVVGSKDCEVEVET